MLRPPGPRRRRPRWPNVSRRGGTSIRSSTCCPWSRSAPPLPPCWISPVAPNWWSSAATAAATAPGSCSVRPAVRWSSAVPVPWSWSDRPPRAEPSGRSSPCTSRPVSAELCFPTHLPNASARATSFCHRGGGTAVITGYLLSDRYQVGDVVGQGGMSVVLHGRDMRLDRDVAIKVLRADLVADDKYEARFRHEASNAASLNHPAIVRVYDTGETDDEDGAVPFIVMEYVNGETLREALAREGEFSTRRALEIAADICAALDFSHRHGIVHRNISPKNVMLDTTGAVKVMDFGVARALAAGAGSTSTSAMVETAEYLSPEQARGEPVDARSDVYSVGCVLDEMLTGKPPFTARSAVEVADQHVHRAPTAPSEIDPGISPDIDSIVLTALDKSPLNRYQTAAQMRTELSRALAAQRIRTAQPRSDTAEQPGSGLARLPSGGSGSAPL